jgi:hypothetical protein
MSLLDFSYSCAIANSLNLLKSIFWGYVWASAVSVVLVGSAQCTQWEDEPRAVITEVAQQGVTETTKSWRAKTRTLLLELGVENFILNSVLAKVM